MNLELITTLHTRLPTAHGDFVLHYYRTNQDEKEHLALVKGVVAQQEDVPVRVHSECITGDVFGSRRCDCGEQLARAMQFVENASVGVVLYLRQEGRGIGLRDKLKAYNLQDKHQWDTEEANVAMGHQADDRNFLAAAEILYSLGFKTFDLLTHNPQKANELTHWGLVINQVISLEIIPTEFNKKYLETKSQKFGHRNLEGDQNGKFH